jgi:hypothetical protein
VTDPPDQPEAADPLRDDFRRFEYECPKCGRTLTEYTERCPYCGQNLFEVFSGTFRPRRSRGFRIVSIALLVGLFVLIVLVIGGVIVRAFL